MPQPEPAHGRLQLARLEGVSDDVPRSATDDLPSLIHRLNNQLGVILAHAELLEAKAPDDAHRARATQVVSAALQAVSLARQIRQTMAETEAAGD
jgi:hypothetical protein